jgi:L-rhamnose mutarotase
LDGTIDLYTGGSGGFGMKRVAFLIKVRQDKIDEYKKQHQAVWPEMLDALQRNGWHNYSLFMCTDGLIVGYMETPENLEAARAAMRKEDVYAKWQASMAPLVEPLAEPYPGLRTAELEQVFHLD